MNTSEPLQLSLPSSGVCPVWDERSLTGCWSAGERWLSCEGTPVAVNLWFHFFEGGEAILSLRSGDHSPTRVHGRWWLEGPVLVVTFGGGSIRSSFALQEDVLQWAGEILLRLPDQTASLPFGIRLPYRLTGHEQLSPAAPAEA